MDLNFTSCWDSILERVKPHIPSIDFDSSPSENEEINTIYKRAAGLSLTVPEDFDSFSVDEDELEELLKPELQTCCLEESLKLDDGETQEGITAAHRSYAGLKADERHIVESNEDKLDASVKPNVDGTKYEEGFTVLSFARLDQWDLDDALQNLTKDGLSLQQHVLPEPTKTCARVDQDRLQDNIMERLVALCKSQSFNSVPKPAKCPEHVRHSKMWNKSQRMDAELQLSHQECPTVYIDLRCPDPSIKPPRPSSNLSSESTSPAKHNTHQETPPAKKPNVKVCAGLRMGSREMTGKSMLLQKIREMNGNGDKYPPKCTDPPYSVTWNKTKELKEKLPRPLGTTQNHESHQSENRTFKEPKQQSEQHQAEQTLKQLEKHRPTKSVHQKQPAAERTDVLFDYEASYQQPVTTLPAGIESKACMLLTVHLSSLGMVGDRARGKRKHLYSAATESHIYNTLVAWFLTLVGSDQSHHEGEVGAKVPFWVAGLQQLWTEDGLALHVLAVARHCYAPRIKDPDAHTPFYNHVFRFLSETSLPLIACWLPHLKHLLDQQGNASPIHLPAPSLNCFISATSNKEVIERTFGLSPGFYWQTVETQERVCKGRETAVELHTEVSFALGSKAFFLHPHLTHYTFQLVLDCGLDVCGLRLLYPPQGFLSDSAGAAPVIQRPDETCQPFLALAVRGPHAHSVLKNLISSLDPLMPGKTDQTPFNPPRCTSEDPPLFSSTCPLATQVHRELSFWFSGRLTRGITQNHSWPLNRAVPSADTVGGSLLSLNRSPAFLCATTKADLLLVVSPVVPPCCYGQVLAVCERRGFSLRGLQRLQLQSKSAAVLGLTSQQELLFCSPHTVTLYGKELELPSRCLVLLLRKENARRHSFSLTTAIMREFKRQKLLGHVHSRLDGVHTVEPSFCFHTVPYSSSMFQTFVRCMWTVPDPSGVILSHQKCSSNSDLEQVVILTLCGKDTSQGLSFLNRVLAEEGGGDVQHSRFELLGLKSLPALTRLQAQELSPYEVGQQLCQHILDSLMSSPALVCALRRVDAFASLRKLLPHDYPGNLSVLMSPTPEVAFRQASLFFFEHEMTPDPQMPLTVCLLKPRIWNHVHKIVHRLQLSGLMLVGLRIVTLDKSSAHVEHSCSGSSLALCFEGENAVRRLQEVLGQEDSSLWTTSSGMMHLISDIYGSGSCHKAIQDVRKFFPEGLCCTETSTVRKEPIPSLCSDPLSSVEREQKCTLAPVAQKSLSPNGGSLIHSAVGQTTCLLIPVNAPPLSQVPFQLDMLEQLLMSGCHLVAGRMSKLDNEQRKHIAEILTESSKGNDRTAHLYKTPCLIMALQGESTVTRFSSILESIYKGRPDLEEVGKTIIYPENEKQATQLICYLFDALSPESRHTIVP